MTWIWQGVVIGVVIGVVLAAHAEWRGKPHPRGTLIAAVVLVACARWLAG